MKANDAHDPYDDFGLSGLATEASAGGRDAHDDFGLSGLATEASACGRDVHDDFGLSGLATEASGLELQASDDDFDSDSGPSPVAPLDESNVSRGGHDTRDDVRLPPDIAVATAVDDDNEADYVYNAIEYDPDSKPPLHRNARFKAYTTLALVLVGVVVLLFILYGIKATRENEYHDIGVLWDGMPTLAPSYPPTTNRMVSGVREQLESLFSMARNETFDALDDADPRSRALEWILHGDGLQLESDAVPLYQRFVLAVLAYALNAGAWYNCGVASRRARNGTYDESECLFFVERNAFYNCKDRELYNPSMAEEDCFAASVWLSSTPECSWFGVICSEDGVLRGIRLAENVLIGQLPHELGTLSSLQLLSLPHNCLYGTIPPELGTIRHLLSLELHGNGLSGEIPSSLYALENLQLLNLAEQIDSSRVCTGTDGSRVAVKYAMGGTREPLADNEGLTGALGPEVGNWRSMKGLYLFNNAFVGGIPEEIGEMKHLTFLWLNDNFIEGSLPAAITKLPKLKDLRLDDNFLVSSLPSDLGQLARLQILYLNGNSMFGELPASLYELKRLKELRLDSTLMREAPWLEVSDEGFNGTLSKDIGNLQELRRLYLSDNPFTGTIPTELGLCEKLEVLHIHHTNFNGTAPDQLCKLRDKNLNSHANVGIFYADCRPENSTGPPFLECLCCSDCCDHLTGVCIADD